MEVFIEKVISFSSFASTALHESISPAISAAQSLLSDGVSSNSKSSAFTSKASAKSTKTCRLSFVFPVSMWLMWVVEMPKKIHYDPSPVLGEAAFMNIRLLH